MFAELRFNFPDCIIQGIVEDLLRVVSVVPFDLLAGPPEHIGHRGEPGVNVLAGYDVAALLIKFQFPQPGRDRSQADKAGAVLAVSRQQGGVVWIKRDAGRHSACPDCLVNFLADPVVDEPAHVNIQNPANPLEVLFAGHALEPLVELTEADPENLGGLLSGKPTTGNFRLRGMVCCFSHGCTRVSNPVRIKIEG